MLTAGNKWATILRMVAHYIGRINKREVMCKTVKFLIENTKNIVFLIGVFGTIIAFLVTLYGLPSRLDRTEKDVQSMTGRVEHVELRLDVIEGSFKDVKEDLKDIKADIKLLLRTK